MLDAQHNDLLRGMTPQEMEPVLPELQKREYAAGQTILRYGEPGDCLYLIESGLVRVELPNPGGDGRTLAQLGPGQVFGELAILTGQPRSAEVRALVETVAYRLSISSFFEVAGRSPTMLLNLARVMAGRLGQMTRATSHRERRALVALVGSVPPLIGSLIATNLVAALALVSGRRAMLLDVPHPRATPLPGREWSPDLEQIRAGAETLVHLSELPVGPVRLHAVNLPERLTATADPVTSSQRGTAASPGEGAEMVSRALGVLTRAAEFIVVNLTGPAGQLVDRVLPMASHAYLVVPSGQAGDSEPAALARRCRARLGPDAIFGAMALSGDGASARAVRERVQASLGVARVEVLPGQAELLRQAARVEPPLTVHGPQLAVSKDITRLAREVAGLRVGLALGGGAARGVSHVGVVAALDRLGVPLDAVAGTSIGALVGAGVSMGMDMRQVEETMNRLLELWGAALRPALPRVALLSGNGLERILQQLAGDVRIEELPIPYGAVAADLDTGRTVYMRRGSVARAVRASISLPVVFPPVVIDGYTLVDGGVTNLVPTELARLLGADVVLACDVSEAQADQSPLEFAEPAPEQAARRARSPNILQTYLRCIDMMKAGRGERDCLSADLTFRPRIPQMGWKEFQKVDTPILAGKQAVADELENLRELLPWLRVPL